MKQEDLFDDSPIEFTDGIAVKTAVLCSLLSNFNKCSQGKLNASVAVVLAINLS
jgi:hypothetical protein